MRKISRRKEEVFKLLDQLFGAEQTGEGVVRSLSICDEFPDELWALYYPSEEKYYCVKTPNLGAEPGVLSLVTTSSRELAEIFIEALDDEYAEGCVPKMLYFDEAREEAQKREKVQALLLVDDPDKTKMHFVK
jgi:hypothetical protein